MLWPALWTERRRGHIAELRKRAAEAKKRSLSG
jgi:hypothetical protein